MNLKIIIYIFSVTVHVTKIDNMYNEEKIVFDVLSHDEYLIKHRKNNSCLCGSIPILRNQL
jgi:hypothetical protein